MQKTYCDLCGREIAKKEDTRYLAIQDADTKPCIVEKEICVFCVEDIKKFLEERSNVDKS